MPTEAQQSDFDFIIVGSGAGGGPLAANLAKSGFRVLMMEAGGDDSDNVGTQIPAFHPLITEDESVAWSYYVDHYSKQPDRDFKYQNGKGILYPRCSTLGGCTVHNALITVCPSNNDWDQIAQITGDGSWCADNMRRYWERLERCRYGLNKLHDYIRSVLSLFNLPWNPGRRGFDGWLTTSTADPKLLLDDKKLLRITTEAIEQSFEEKIGNPLRRLFRGMDLNDWRVLQSKASGIALTPLSSKQGKRIGPREYLKQTQKQFPDRLVIKTNVLVCRVIFEDSERKAPKAVGVEYVQGKDLYKASPNFDLKRAKQVCKNERQTVYARREIILSAGAFNTPQLLMLSGIGPEKELRKHRIPITHALPGVGQNLQDRYEIGVVVELNSNLKLLKNAQFKIDMSDPNFAEWEKFGTGLYSSNGSVIGLTKRSTTDKPVPDLYIFGVASEFKGYEPGYSRTTMETKNRFSWMVLKGHTNNQAGTVQLNSKNPWDVPNIHFHYFDEGSSGWEGDVEGVKFIRRMNSDAGLKGIIEQETYPGPDFSSGDQLRQKIRDDAWGHHASCTCPIGTNDDPMAVLDANFRVRGVRNLRIVDASVFPKIPGLFIAASIYSISEKASDVIAAAHGHCPSQEAD